jgi:S-DNA-T family DNA segregation ATPase FtsK/SpoIIIE
MEIVVQTPRGLGEVTLSEYGQATTLGDVAALVTGAPSPAVVSLDGTVLAATTTLGDAGLRTGSLLALESMAAETTPLSDTTIELVQIAGPGAGRRRSLPAGRYAVGDGRRERAVELELAPVARPSFVLNVHEDGRCDVTAESRRVLIDGVRVEGTSPWAGGVLVAEGRAFVIARGRRRVRRLGSAGHPRGLVPFNRPPRQPPEAPLGAVEVPDGGGSVRDRRTLPVLALIAPVPLAIAMAVMLGRPSMLLFALLSPVMMIANWVEDRRARRRELTSSTRADAEAEAGFRRLVQRAHTAELGRSRRAHPDIAELICRASTWSPQLWERRPESPDAWQIPVGLVDVAWSPDLRRGHAAIASADDIVDAAGPLTAVPVVADLATSRGVAVVGSGEPALAIARGAIIAAATVHGPADLDIVVCTDQEHSARWEWVKWLPHARASRGPRLFIGLAPVAGWVDEVTGERDDAKADGENRRITLVIVDIVSWWHGRDAPLRRLLGEARPTIRYLVIAPDVRLAPSLCTTVIDVAAHRSPPEGRRVTIEDVVGQRRSELLPFSLDTELATATARALAPVEDADVQLCDGHGLPDRLSVLDLLDLAVPTPDAIARRWAMAGRAPRPLARVGITHDAQVEIDLVDDGPHGLIAGTTGAGKSELLRSLIVSLAASLPPDDLNFVLVDFKGGAAFDACARLPHTVGLVTDLDEHLAGRVLRCLRAELHRREVVLRAASATSLVDYQRAHASDPLPRLVVVVDEFATVAAELPGFVPSLVDVAQRGRSLGIHMLLATQRPAGVVDAKIKANTNLRIALRVQDDSDSVDVIGMRDAATLPRAIPGRAYARFGAGDVVQFQSAYSTGTSNVRGERVLTAAPWVFGRPLSPVETGIASRGGDGERSVEAVGAAAARPDLELLVEAISAAAADIGQADQRRPYPDPLPAVVSSAELEGVGPGDGVPLGLVDLPDEQRRAVRCWTPGADGSLVVYGVTGAGTSSLLATLVVAAARRCSPDEFHVFAIDADSNLLAPLDGLPHCGAVTGLDDLPRVARVVRSLIGDVARRKERAIELGGPVAVVQSEPAVVLAIDNVGALRQAVDDDRGLTSLWGELEQVIRDGQGLGICTVVAAKHERALPATMSGQFRHRLVMDLGDKSAYTSFGLRPGDVPEFVPGRALDPANGSELHVVQPPPVLADAVADVARQWPPTASVRRVDALPATVALDDLLPAAGRDDTTIHLPIGLDTATAAPAVLSFPDGTAAFVAGPSRSGRTTVLEVIARAAIAADPDISVYTICPRPGRLAAVAGLRGVAARPGEVAPLVEHVLAAGGRRLVVVDDADRLAGPSLDELAAHRDDHLIAVIAGRADDLRALGHWSRPLQRSRTGVLLRPVATDGDLLRVALPLRLPVAGPGTGFLVDDGVIAPLLVARPGTDD